MTNGGRDFWSRSSIEGECCSLVKLSYNVIPLCNCTLSKCAHYGWRYTFNCAFAYAYASCCLVYPASTLGNGCTCPQKLALCIPECKSVTDLFSHGKAQTAIISVWPNYGKDACRTFFLWIEDVFVIPNQLLCSKQPNFIYRNNHFIIVMSTFLQLKWTKML